MKENMKNTTNINLQTGELKDFFEEFDAHCLLNKSDKNKLKLDFEKAFLYYSTVGVSQEKALELLSIKNLGNFYGTHIKKWFPLDDAAKLYPLSMERGRMSTARLAVYLKENVIPELLQVALNFTIKRFPTFAVTIKKGFFWHYLDMTSRRFCIEPENEIPCTPIKISRSGSQAFRIFYYQNRISMEMFHALSDGLGAVYFIKSLIAEYLRLTGKEIVLDETVFDINTIPSSEEFENSFEKVSLTGSISTLANKPVLQMGGKLARNKPCRIVHFKINATELKTVCRKYHTTVARYFLALIFVATKNVIDKSSGEINIQVPVNLRSYYLSKTLRNFVLPCGICLPIETIKDVETIIPEINRQMKTKTSKESMSELIASTKSLINMVKYVPLALKQPVARIGYGFWGDKAFTTILSDLGVVRMPQSISEHIESMDAIIGPSITQRARCVAVTFNNTTTLSITKSTNSPVFEEKIYELLCADKISVTVEGSEKYGD